MIHVSLYPFFEGTFCWNLSQHTCLYHLWGDSIQLCEDNQNDRREIKVSSSCGTSQLSKISQKKKERKRKHGWKMYFYSQVTWNCWNCFRKTILKFINREKWPPWGRGSTFLGSGLRIWPCTCSVSSHLSRPFHFLYIKIYMSFNYIY